LDAIPPFQCRHVLQWTYAYGFYLKESSEKALFETYQVWFKCFLGAIHSRLLVFIQFCVWLHVCSTQEQLEKFTEHLHELAEKPLSELQEIKMRTDVINYTRVTERVCHAHCLMSCG
jgi:hypothetical protein